MITHEEARKIAQDMLPKQVGSISSRNKVRNYFQLDLYFKQQEKKEERAKKVEELWQLEHKARLTLVECMNNPKDEQLKSDYFAYLMRIEQLEEETK